MLACIHFLLGGCTRETNGVVQLRHYHLECTDGLITRSNISIDKNISSDRNGSLPIATREPVAVRLFELGEIDIGNARLNHRARLPTQDGKGQTSLEMWCHFPGKAEFFSRGPQALFQIAPKGHHRKYLFSSRKVKILSI